jgi:hypothetical protein
MTKYINKLESWKGWLVHYLKYCKGKTPTQMVREDPDNSDLKSELMVYGFIDQIVENHVKHKNPLSYNTEEDATIPEDLCEYFYELLAKKEKFTATLEYEFCEKPDIPIDDPKWVGSEHDKLEFTLHDLTKCKNPIGKEFLDKGYTMMLHLRMADTPCELYVIG